MLKLNIILKLVVSFSKSGMKTGDITLSVIIPSFLNLESMFWSTESFIFSSNGINFLPPPPPTTNKLNEEYYVNMTHHGLLDGKYRFRFVLEIPFEHSDGSPGTITDTKIVYKAEKEIDQNLINKIISIGVSSNSESDNVFDINFSFESINENDLIKIEHSSDLENWSEFGWKHGSGLLEQSVEGKENFFRGVIY